MKTTSLLLCSVRSLSLATLVLAASATQAQPLPPFPPNPLAPVLQPPVPLGIQRGTTLDLTLTGTNLADPTAVWTNLPGRVSIPADGKNGKDPTKFVAKVEVAKDAPLGIYGIRVATLRGMSNMRLFCVDDLPQVMEVATNHTVATAQPVAFPCVVVGLADAEATDYFKVTVTAGQRVSFEVVGRRLGSVFDPQLTLYDKTGRELFGGYNNDAPGLQTDSRLTYVFKAAGEYVLGLRDVSYRGGGDFHYRLRIGDFPCVTTPIPLAVKRGSKTPVNFTGTMTEGVAPVEVTAPTDPQTQAVWVTPRGANGLNGWPVMLTLSDLDEVVEQEPNNEPAKANRVPVPGAVTGRLLEKGDIDHYVLPLKKGTGYRIEAHTSEHHSPTEVYMTLRDAKGMAQLAATNPAMPPRLAFTPPADGDFILTVEHIHGWGGPDEVYRVTVVPNDPGFDLVLPTDRLDVPPGGAAGVPVYLTRQGYAGAIELSVVGATGVTGTATIGAGTAPPPNVAAATLVLTAGAGEAPGPRVFRIAAKATINGKAVTQFVSVRNPVSQGLGNLPVPPRTLIHDLALAITEKPPFLLAVKFDQPSTAPGAPAAITVTATRAAGFTGEIAITAVGMPPNVAPALKNIPANMNEVKAQFNLAPNAPLGQFPITINGKGKHAMRDWSVNAAPVTLVVKK
jgi:hypothetical protein